MNNENLVKALQELACGDARSETARLRDIFPQIENALNAGVSRSAVLSELHKQGFKMKSRSFESALYRLRKEKDVPTMKCSNSTLSLKIAGFDVAPPKTIQLKQTSENDLLK